MIPPETLTERFQVRFGRAPTCWAVAPGRVNLIGEHTDYNEGYVLPAAINRAVTVVAAPVEGGECRIYSEAYEEEQSLDLGAPERALEFGRYAAAIAWALGAGTAFNAYVASDLPLASGVSSSGAFEMSLASLWDLLEDRGMGPVDRAKTGKRAENEFIGLKSGIMDQLASAAGRKGHCLLIDTRSLSIRPVRIPPDLAIVVCDTRKPRGLSESAYNERVCQCARAADALSVTSLRDADSRLLEGSRERLEDTIYRRARHVITENERVLHFVDALECSDRPKIGAMMAESHRSLRDDYEVSCLELDAMVEAAKSSEGCAGVRMTGAGFGGCCVALVERNLVTRFVEETSRTYRRTLTLEPEFLICEAAPGANAGFFAKELGRSI